MTKQQRDTIDQMLRHTWGDSSISSNGRGKLDLGGEVEEQRRLFGAMMSAIPLPDDVHTEEAALGDLPVVTITIEGATPTGTILYFHGGAYALGSAALSVGLASELARRSGARAVSVDYALAPEHPYPAAVHDAVAAYQALLDDGIPADDIILAGESSGGGLALAAILAILSTGLPRPAAVYVASPWRPDNDGREHDHQGGFPLLIQVGGNEVLLDDATRLAARAAADGSSHSGSHPGRPARVRRVRRHARRSRRGPN